MRKTMTCPEAAKALGIKTSTLNTYVWARKVKAIKRPGWRTVFDRDYIMSIANGAVNKNAAGEGSVRYAACHEVGTTADKPMISDSIAAVKTEEADR